MVPICSALQVGESVALEQLTCLTGHSGPVMDVAFSACSRQGERGRMSLWRLSIILCSGLCSGLAAAGGHVFERSSVSGTVKRGARACGVMRGPGSKGFPLRGLACSPRA